MRGPDWLTTRPVAHRGLHNAEAGVIENTLDAVEAALAKGFAVEVDIRLTADDRVVVFHDGSLERLTESAGIVSDMTLADLRKVRFRDCDGRIPTLDELLDLIAGRAPLFAELKTDWRVDRKLVARTAEIIATYDGPIAAMSFDHAAMAHMRKLDPTLVRGLVSQRFAPYRAHGMSPWQSFLHSQLIMAASAQPDFIAYNINNLPASPPLALNHFFRLPLLTWTVRTSEHRQTAAEHANQIIFEGFDPDRP